MARLFGFRFGSRRSLTAVAQPRMGSLTWIAERGTFTVSQCHGVIATTIHKPHRARASAERNIETHGLADFVKMIVQLRERALIRLRENSHRGTILQCAQVCPIMKAQPLLSQSERIDAVAGIARVK